MAVSQVESLSGTAQGIMSDIEKLLTLRLCTLKSDLIQELGKASSAGASLGGGVGLAALGTILGGMGFVHLVNRVTGLPLWLCYAGASGAACAAASGLLSQGIEQIEKLDIVPEGTGRVVRQAVATSAR